MALDVCISTSSLSFISSVMLNFIGHFQVVLSKLVLFNISQGET